MSLPEEAPVAARSALLEVPTELVDANEKNPRLDFPQNELDRLADSIDLEGILVPIVVFERDGRYVVVDGERRLRCARDLALPTVPTLITTERPERDVLQQMFNIHLIREPWRDLPTALALGRLADAITAEEGDEPGDSRLAELTGLSVDRVRQLRYVVTLPPEWQGYIREGRVPLNYFWEMKKNVTDQLEKRRPNLLTELGAQAIQTALVEKRLNNVITDTVSLRKVAPIIRFAENDANGDPAVASDIDDAIRTLVTDPQSTIDDAYEDTVQMMVEVDKLGRRTASMVAAFHRLLSQAEGQEEREAVMELAQQLIDALNSELSAIAESDASVGGN